jgi:hypothetical protein
MPATRDGWFQSEPTGKDLLSDIAGKLTGRGSLADR